MSRFEGLAQAPWNWQPHLSSIQTFPTQTSESSTCALLVLVLEDLRNIKEIVTIQFQVSGPKTLVASLPLFFFLANRRFFQT